MSRPTKRRTDVHCGSCAQRFATKWEMNRHYEEAHTCRVVTTPSDPPHIHEVRCGRKLDAQGWCPKHGYETRQDGS